MKTMALTDDTAPARKHRSILSVVSASLPQSSAFTISIPLRSFSPEMFSGDAAWYAAARD
jgi:hypothetical protein